MTENLEKPRMGRDWDCIRAILFALANMPKEKAVIRAHEVEDRDEEVVSYHMHMMIQAGLIEGNCGNARGRISCVASRMTWDGQELFDAIKRHSVWERIQTTVAERGLPFSFEVLKSVASAVIAGMLK